MYKTLFCISFIFCISLNTIAQTSVKSDSTTTANDQGDLSDGPYIFIDNKKLIEKTIIKGKLETKELSKDTYPTSFKPKPAEYKNISKIAALSDIHGQYDLAVKILRNNKIIDENLNWNFGTGHLVIVGDIFDRGTMVTEMLWLVYHLEKQALSAGGNVHYLMGNHEYMVLTGDNRYVNPKYLKVAQMLGVTHQQLFGVNTVLGRWLRSKPTILRINDNLYVHGGVSKELASTNFKINKINKTMMKAVDKKQDSIINKLEDLYFSNIGPIWYRGYFYDNLPKEEITNILDDARADHIVVGHCSNQKVISLYDDLIFGVDSSIKLGEYGEVLFIVEGKYSRGTMDGERLYFND